MTDGRGFVNAGTSQDPARRWQLDLARGPERERRRLEIDEISVRIRDGSAYAIALDGVGYLTELSARGSDRRARPFAGRQYACALLEQAVRFVGRLLSAYFEKTT